MSNSRAPWLVSLLLACVAAGAAAWGYQEHLRYESAARAGDFSETQIKLAQGDNARLQTLVAQQKKDLASAYEASERKSIEAAVMDDPRPRFP